MSHAGWWDAGLFKEVPPGKFSLGSGGIMGEKVAGETAVFPPVELSRRRLKRARKRWSQLRAGRKSV